MKGKILFRMLFFCFLGLATFTMNAQRNVVPKGSMTIKQLFEKVESVSKYRIAYNNLQFDVNKQVTISDPSKEIVELLTDALKPVNLSVKVSGNYITVAPRNPESKSTKVRGVVNDENGEPVIGASVLVKGTNQGTVTDLDGNFAIEASEQSSLVFSYVGMLTQTVAVGKQSMVNVTMKSANIMVEEVVVTAMGVKAEKKKLNFAVQTLDSDELMAGQSANFVNTLQGKVAGLQTSSSGGSPNASTQVIIRAISSINPSQNNEPMFIIDGMPVRGTGTAIGDINPNDIESMTVLKGAAASALYGQDAANGVIMITTKSGKSGKIIVNSSASVQVETAVRVPKIQQMFRPGAQGFYKPLVTGGWGPLLNPEETIYDNVGGFLGTGLFQKYDVSVSGGTDKFVAYASVNYSKNNGVVPNDYKDRLGFLVKATYEVSKNLKLSFSSNYMESKGRGFGNSMSTIYSWPINDDMSNYTHGDGSIRWLFDLDGLTDAEILDVPVNPYWSRYKDKGQTQSSRNFLIGTIDWAPIKDLNFSAKVSMDKSHTFSDGYVTPRYKVSDFKDPQDPDRYGYYSFSPNRSQLLTTQLLGTYKFTFAKDYLVNLLVGFEYNDDQRIEGQMGGAGFVLPVGFYSMQNLSYSIFGDLNDYSTFLYHIKRNRFGNFGEVKLDYKGIAHVSATARRDMSSTLTTKSYFYPSVTAGVIFSELFHLNNDIFTYGKVRGNWARVGKEAPPFRFDRSFKQWNSFPDGGFGVDPAVGSSNKLYPEMADSWEIGTDLRFFRNRTRLDLAYYSTTVSNQIVTVRVSPASGMILQTRNEGAVKNWGIEGQFSQDILEGRDLKWTVGLNFSMNRGTVVSLPEGMIEIQGPQYGDIFPTAFLDHSTTSVSGKDYMRSPEGKILCNADGTPIINPAKGILIGNREPDFLLGLTSSIFWRNLSVSFLLDGRKGGDVVNVTGRGLFSNGQHKSLERYRNREIIVDGVVKQPDGSYLPNTTPIILNHTNMNTYFNVSSNFIEDGSYVRLSHITVGYDFTSMLKNKSVIKGLKLSMAGRNLFLLTKYSGSDPQISAGSSGGTGSMGIDNYGVPNTRSYNITLNATF